MELAAVLNSIKDENPTEEGTENLSTLITEQDRKKILKLFNYDQWLTYMKWVDEKLE